MKEYIDALSVKEIADKLLVECSCFKHLREIPIAYVFKPKASKKGGRVVLGKAIRQNDLQQHLSGYWFVMEIPEDEWKNSNDKEREAIVCHELCHMDTVEKEDKDGNIFLVPTLKDHDIQEFEYVIQRYGVNWQQRLAVDDDDEQEDVTPPEVT